MGDESRVAAALARAQDAARELEKQTEALNAALASAEKAIAALKLGVHASVSIPGGDPDDEPAWRQCLAFGKHGNEWRLLFESGPDGFEEHWSTSLLANTSREVRLMAVSLLPDLVDELVEAAERQARYVGDRAVEAQEFTKAIAKGGRK